MQVHSEYLNISYSTCPQWEHQSSRGSTKSRGMQQLGSSSSRPPHLVHHARCNLAVAGGGLATCPVLIRQQHCRTGATACSAGQRIVTAALPARKQQPQSEDDVGDDSWYTGSGHKSSSPDSSSSSSSRGSSSSNRTSSSIGAGRGRFRRSGGGSAGRRIGTKTSKTTSAAAGPADTPIQEDSVKQPAAATPPQQPQHVDSIVVDGSSSNSSSSLPSLAAAAAAANGPPLSSQLPPGQVDQLRSYLSHLLEVNKVMNLTGWSGGCLLPDGCSGWLAEWRAPRGVYGGCCLCKPPQQRNPCPPTFHCCLSVLHPPPSTLTCVCLTQPSVTQTRPGSAT